MIDYPKCIISCFIDCNSVSVYKIYVDNELRLSLNGNVKCRALVEGVKAMISHRVIVTATTSDGKFTAIGLWVSVALDVLY